MCVCQLNQNNKGEDKIFRMICRSLQFHIQLNEARDFINTSEKDLKIIIATQCELEKSKEVAKSLKNLNFTNIKVWLQKQASKQKVRGHSKKAQEMDLLAPKPDNLSLILGSTWWKGRTESFCLSFNLKHA